MCRVHQHEARALGLGTSGRREHAHTHTVTYQITCGNRSKGPCKEFYLRKPSCYVGNPRESFFFSPGLPAFPPNQFFVGGDRLSQEAARRFVFHFISALLSQSANFLKGEESFSNSIFNTGYGDGSSLIPFHVPSPTQSCQVLMDCLCT